MCAGADDYGGCAQLWHPEGKVHESDNEEEKRSEGHVRGLQEHA